MSGGALMASEALKSLLPACLDEITGWFRLFQSTGEIAAACVYFYLLPWADRAVSAGRRSWCRALSPGGGLSLGSAQEQHPSVPLELQMPGPLGRARIRVQAHGLAGSSRETCGKAA